MPITTGSHPKALWPGVHTFFGNEYERLPKEYPHLFEEIVSELAYEEMVESTAFGLAQAKPQGAGFYYDQHQQGYISRAYHTLWGLGFITTYEEIADNKYLKKSFDRAKMLAYSLHITKEINAAALLNYANDVTGHPFGDGAALCSNAHPTVSGNQSNIAANAADISEAAVEDLLVQISLATDNRGNRIANPPKCVVVSAQDQFNIARILHSPLQSGTGNNDINAMRHLKAFPRDYIVNHYLNTAPPSWFILTELPNGLTLFQREKYKFIQDNDGDSLNAKAKAFERYVFTCGEWRQIYENVGV
jgi:hypothetical protein